MKEADFREGVIAKDTNKDNYHKFRLFRLTSHHDYKNFLKLVGLDMYSNTNAIHRLWIGAYIYGPFEIELINLAVKEISKLSDLPNGMISSSLY